MTLTAQQKHRLKRFIKEIKLHKALHTELISVYIPQNYDLNKIINHLHQEQGTAVNIKSKTTRKNVQAALEKMIQHLRIYRKTPPHGLAVFSGNIAAKEGQTNFQVWSIEPPLPLKIRLYRCDKEFVLDLLEEMLEEKRLYGLVVMDRRDANLALLKGKTIIPLAKTHSHVPGKFKAGGQCLYPKTKVFINNKLAPLHQIKKGDYLKSYNFSSKKIINSLCLKKWLVSKKELFVIKTKFHRLKCSSDHLFFIEEKNKVITKPASQLRKNDLLFSLQNNQIKKTKIISITKKTTPRPLIDITVQNKNFFANNLIVHNSAQRFARLIEGAAKDHFKKVADYLKQEFFQKKDLKGIIIGGPGPTKYDFVEGNYLLEPLKKKILAIKDLSYTGEFGLQELLDKSQDILAQEEIAEEKKLMQNFLSLLAKQPHKTAYGLKETKHALTLGAVDTLLLSESLDDKTIDKFTHLAEQTASQVALISTETREGIQLKDLGGIAAILRFEI